MLEVKRNGRIIAQGLEEVNNVNPRLATGGPSPRRDWFGTRFLRGFCILWKIFWNSFHLYLQAVDSML